jgi:hypothetical protein
VAKEEGDRIIFDAGKVWHSEGVIGLSPDLMLYEGYDQKAAVDLNAAQRDELADLMIARWTAFKRGGRSEK